MDDLIDLFNGLIQQSYKQYQSNHPDYERWKCCVVLSKCGWRSKGLEYLPGDAVIIHWAKDGLEDILIELSFIEQCKWLKYLNTEEIT